MKIPSLALLVSLAAFGGQSPVSFHGGPVMSGSVNIYYIWYGNWDGNTAVPILTDLALNINDSAYYAITQDYNAGPDVRFANAYYDRYSLGSAKVVPDAVVQHALETNALPIDAEGVYIVLTSADVSVPGFKTLFCGIHSYFNFTRDWTIIKYAFVGDSQGWCSAQWGKSPNDNPSADSMASVLAHELAETVTDPQLSAWFESDGDEIGDKCNWQFGPESIAPNGSRYNVTLGNRNYLLQQLWVNSGDGFCSTHNPVRRGKHQ